MGVARRRELPESETKDWVAHSIAGSTSFGPSSSPSRGSGAPAGCSACGGFVS